MSARFAKAMKAAEEVLERVNTVEKALALKGAERAEYLKALDETYGPRAQRAADMGFGERTYIHGSKSNFDAIDPSKLGSSTKANSATEAFFATDNPDVSGRFGYIAPTPARSRYDELSRLYDEKIELRQQKLAKSGKPWTREEMDRLESSREMKSLLKDIKDAGRLASEHGIRGRLTDEFAVSYPVRVKEPGNVVERGGSNIWGDGHSDGQIKPGVNLFKNAVDDPHMRAPVASNIVAVTDPTSVRSIHAAFDPRFKDSAKLLAGMSPVGAAIQGNVQTPDEYLGQAYDAYDTHVAKPLSSLAKRVFTPEVNVAGQAYPTASTMSDFILESAASPVNYVPGPAGAALTLAELAGASKSKKKGGK